MKRALIAIASVGFLASTAWVVAANAQANINPNVYRGNTSGPYGAQAPWEWHAGPGPNKRGGMCVTHTDIGRGYGYQAACPAPKAAAGPEKGKKKNVAARWTERGRRRLAANERAADVDCDRGCGFRKRASGRSSFARMTRRIRPAACDACGRPQSFYRILPHHELLRSRRRRCAGGAAAAVLPAKSSR